MRHSQCHVTALSCGTTSCCGRRLTVWLATPGEWVGWVSGWGALFGSVPPRLSLAPALTWRPVLSSLLCLCISGCPPKRERPLPRSTRTRSETSNQGHSYLHLKSWVRSCWSIQPGPAVNGRRRLELVVQPARLPPQLPWPQWLCKHPRPCQQGGTAWQHKQGATAWRKPEHEGYWHYEGMLALRISAQRFHPVVYQFAQPVTQQLD